VQDNDGLQVLQTVVFEKKTGVLQVQGESGRATLGFRGGKLISAATAGELTDSLLAMLRNAGYITDQQQSVFSGYKLDNAGMAAKLLREGIVGKDAVLGCIKIHIAAILKEIAGWEYAEFTFTEGEQTNVQLLAPVNIEKAVNRLVPLPDEPPPSPIVSEPETPELKKLPEPPEEKKPLDYLEDWMGDETPKPRPIEINIGGDVVEEPVQDAEEDELPWLADLKEKGNHFDTGETGIDIDEDELPEWMRYQDPDTEMGLKWVDDVVGDDDEEEAEASAEQDRGFGEIVDISPRSDERSSDKIGTGRFRKLDSDDIEPDPSDEESWLGDLSDEDLPVFEDKAEKPPQPSRGLEEAQPPAAQAPAPSAPPSARSPEPDPEQERSRGGILGGLFGSKEKEEEADRSGLSGRRITAEPPPGRIAPTEEPLSTVQFSAFTPLQAQANTRYGLYLYAHIEDAIEQVQRHVNKFREELGGAVPGPRVARDSVDIAADTPITVVPESSDVEFDPVSLTKRWNKPYTLFNFEFTPTSKNANDLIVGRFSIQVSGIEVANIRFAIDVVDTSQGQTELMLTSFTSDDPNPLAQARYSQSTTVTPYNKIFVSYSRNDIDVVEAYRKAQLALGHEVFMDTYSIRTGENWQAALARAIDEADILQLFWSEEAAISENVHHEWDYALRYRCPQNKCIGFIRPVYWRQPLPVPPPDELSHLNFRYVPLSDEGET